MTLFTLFFTKATRNTLKGRFAPEETGGLIEETWRRYDELAPEFPDSTSPTGDFFMRFAGAELALYLSLVDHDIEAGEARQMVADVNWSLVAGGTLLERAMRLQYKLTRIASSDPVRRLKWCLAPLWRFIFTIPPWEKIDLPSNDGVLALNVMRCPLANFFQSFGQPELGAATFCAADVRFAEIWGFDLKRSGLRMTGAPICDFRFTPKAQ
jgi:hypothetical protein